MNYSKEDFKSLFQAKFDYAKWFTMLKDFFKADELRTTAEPITDPADCDKGYYIGAINTSDSYRIGLFYYEIGNSNVARKKVGLRNLVKTYINSQWGQFDAALAVFSDGNQWRLSLISDIKGEATAAKRFTFVFGSENCLYKTPISRFIALQSSGISFTNIKEAFSVEGLSEQFYNDLFKWYLWAVDDAEVSFPNITEALDETERRTIKCEHIIRLITRLLFCWFIKQKRLIPNEIFTFEWAENILSHFNKSATGEGEYYNAILQNLFFATLNNEIKSRKWAKNSNFQGKDPYYGIKCFYRDNDDEKPSLFSSEGKIIMEKTFAHVPYLNGGLFECLDKEASIDNNKVVYIDGFSRENSLKKRAMIPNILFFNEDENQLGLFPLLKRYNFTIDENSQDDVEISLDPELLGRVFENLLADYNPETQESARKATGSFYTPRVIVDYMVNESLITYLSEKGLDNNKLRNLINTNVHVNDSDWLESDKKTIIDSLKSIRILDPACGSGAFPMGCLLKIVNIIQRLDTKTNNFYELKLDIINNCIFGIDIQPIAMMISKLRFFISLLCEQNDVDLNDPEHNFGVNTLPNLETKFVAANSLISADIEKYEGDWTRDEELSRLKEELLNIRKSQFLSTSRMQKLEKRREDRNKRKEINEYIIRNTSSPDEKKISMYEAQIETLKDQLLQYKGEKWVDDWIQQQPTLFETPQASLFRHDINKEKREALNLKIKGIETEIKKEKQKGEIKGFEAAVKQITLWNPYDQNSSSPFFNSEWMFGIKDGFDIVIGNPPYISTKGISDEDKKKYVKEFDFSDDTYYLFAVKGLQFTKPQGTLNYIIPKTFWTTQTKRGMRDMILSLQINYIYDTADPFDAPMVDTCIIQVENISYNGKNKVRFLDGSKNLKDPIFFKPIEQQVWLDTQNSVIFKPTDLNMRIFHKYGRIVKELYDKWWDKIKTSRDIEKNKKELEEYRASLKPGDITLLGCLTDGGVGLQTGNNGRYIAVRESTKWANNIKISRPKKLVEAIKKHKINLPQTNEFPSIKDFVASLSEAEIAQLFDSLKDKYGRDIFGQGYLYKIIKESEIANVDLLSDEEKENGIETTKPFYVPYDKGDKDGNRWYLETPFAIAWSKENVRFLKTNSGKKGIGMPVVRNPQFYFREGLCWSEIKTHYIRCRLKEKTVNSNKSMAFYSCSSGIPIPVIVLLLNSEFIANYVNSFINNTQTFGIDDARQIFVKIPDNFQLSKIDEMLHKAINEKISSKIDNLKNVQKQIDKFISSLYGF